jgi:hypothetical protein
MALRQARARLLRCRISRQRMAALGHSRLRRSERARSVVRFTSKSGHRVLASVCLLCANRVLTRRSKKAPVLIVECTVQLFLLGLRAQGCLEC